MSTPLIDDIVIALDTRAPQTISTLILQVVSGDGVQCNWNAATDQTFNHYEIWYGTDQSDVQNRTGGAVEWDDSDDGALVNRLTTITTVEGVPGGVDLYFSIFAIDDFGQETRVDAAGTVNTEIESAPFTFDLDTLGPRNLATLTLTQINSTSIQCDFEAVTDPSFNHFEIWYGNNLVAVQTRNIGLADEWDDSNDPALATASTTTTTVTGLSSGATLYFSIFAIDDFGNEATRIDAGPIVLSDATETLFNGAIAVDSGSAPTFAGKIWAKSSNPMVWFGEIQIYDDATATMNGTTAIVLTSGSLFNGNIYLSSASTAVINGATTVFVEQTPIFDGNIFLLADIIAIATGAIQVVETSSALFDARVFAYGVSTPTFDARLELGGVKRLFNGYLDIEALPKIILFRPHYGATDVLETSHVYIEFEGYPAVNLGGLDAASIFIALLTPELITVYDGTSPQDFPDVVVTGDQSRLSVSFPPPFEDEQFASNTTFMFDVACSNDAGQTVDQTYSFSTRLGSAPMFRRGKAIYEYDVGTEVNNLTRFVWQGDGLVKMRLKFDDTAAGLRGSNFDGEFFEPFRGAEVDSSIWDITAPTLQVTQDEVLHISGVQDSEELWGDETRLEYIGSLSRSYNVAVDTRLLVDKASTFGASSFLEITHGNGNSIRLEKIYSGFPNANDNIVPHEGVTITSFYDSTVLSTSNVFPQTFNTPISKLIYIDIEVTTNDIPLTAFDRMSLQFSAGVPTAILGNIYGSEGGFYTVEATINSTGNFEIIESDILPAFDPNEPVERLSKVRFAFWTTETTTTIDRCEILNVADALDTRLRVLIDGIEQYRSIEVVDPLRFDQLKIEVERRSVDVYLNGVSVFRRYMNVSGSRFAIGAAGRTNGDVVEAEYNNLIVRNYYDSSPVPLSLSARYMAYEVTLKAPEAEV